MSRIALSDEKKGGSEGECEKVNHNSDQELSGKGKDMHFLFICYNPGTQYSDCPIISVPYMTVEWLALVVAMLACELSLWCPTQRRWHLLLESKDTGRACEVWSCQKEKISFLHFLPFAFNVHNLEKDI